MIEISKCAYSTDEIFNNLTPVSIYLRNVDQALLIVYNLGIGITFMKKTPLLLIVSTLLLTSCGFLRAFKPKSSSEEDTSSISTVDSDTSKTSSYDLSAYEDCKDYEWFNIGLERYTDYLGNNIYFNSLRRYELFAKGKYMCNDDYYGHYNFFICDNKDVMFDSLTKMYAFDKSEYTVTEINPTDRCYDMPADGLTREEAIYDYYFELAAHFAGVAEEHLSYNDTVFMTLSDVYGFYGIILQSPEIGTVDIDTTFLYVCRNAHGYGPTFKDKYVFSKYMDNVYTYRYVGVPPFLSIDNMKSWSYERKYTDRHGYRIWVDSKLTLSFTGYSIEEARSWPYIMELAEYDRTSLQDNLDSETYPSLIYEAKINMLGYISNMNHNSSSHFLQNSIKIHYFTLKRNPVGPEDYIVDFTIEFTKPTVWDGHGLFIYQDEGLMFYYTFDTPETIQAKIVNKVKQLETKSVRTSEDVTASFFFPRKNPGESD